MSTLTCDNGSAPAGAGNTARGLTQCKAANTERTRANRAKRNGGVK